MPLDIQHYHTLTNQFDDLSQNIQPDPLADPAASSFGLTNTKKHQPVLITILNLENSLFVHIGLEEQNDLTNLFLSTITKFSDQPLTTPILNTESTQEQSDLGETLSARLSRKCKVPVVLSFNLVDRDLGVEKFLFEKIGEVMEKNEQN
jgi:hypothetical protein